jgi:cell division septum initiation protein DivIVA
VNLQTFLDLITEREAAALHNADRLREQITTLTAELTHIDAPASHVLTPNVVQQPSSPPTNRP